MHYMNEVISDDCFGCDDKSSSDKEHSCKRDSSILIDEYFDESVSNKELIGKRFVDLFNHFCQLLCIEDSNKNQGNEQIMILEKAQKKDLFSTLLDLMDKDGKNNESKAIIRLIEIKNKSSIDVNQLKVDSDEKTGNFSQIKRKKI